MTEKEHVVLLIGAGASKHAGIPLTADLTAEIVSYELRAVVEEPLIWTADKQYGDPFHLFANPAESRSLTSAEKAPKSLQSAEPIYGVILQILNRCFEVPNFEHIFAALEDLQSIAQSQRQPTSDSLKNVLAPFVTLSSDYRILHEPIFLRYARKSLVKLVSRIIQQRIGGMPNLSDIQQFFNCLQENYRVSIFTLNYDDLLERAALDLRSGFSRAHNQFDQFNQVDFLKSVESNAEILCHLHGSIRFGYTSDSPHFTELVQYNNAASALQSIDAVQREDKNVNGDFVANEPIISGFNKIAKLTYSKVPYRYYYQALTQRLAKCSRLIIIGYSGLDEHVNALLEEFKETHKDRRRIIFVTPCSGIDPDRNTPLSGLIQKLAGEVGAVKFSESMQSTSGSGQHLVEFSQYNNLVLCAAGFPFHNFDGTMTSVLRFLAS